MSPRSTRQGSHRKTSSRKQNTAWRRTTSSSKFRARSEFSRKRGTPARYAPGLPTENFEAAPTGSPSAASQQPHLVTATHMGPPPFLEPPGTRREPAATGPASSQSHHVRATQRPHARCRQSGGQEHRGRKKERRKRGSLRGAGSNPSGQAGSLLRLSGSLPRKGGREKNRTACPTKRIARRLQTSRRVL